MITGLQRLIERVVPPPRRKEWLYYLLTEPLDIPLRWLGHQFILGYYSSREEAWGYDENGQRPETMRAQMAQPKLKVPKFSELDPWFLD